VQLKRVFLPNQLKPLLVILVGAENRRQQGNAVTQVHSLTTVIEHFLFISWQYWRFPR
jgi:hypothetical protein